MVPSFGTMQMDIPCILGRYCLDIIRFCYSLLLQGIFGDFMPKAECSTLLLKLAYGCLSGKILHTQLV